MNTLSATSGTPRGDQLVASAQLPPVSFHDLLTPKAGKASRQAAVVRVSVVVREARGGNGRMVCGFLDRSDWATKMLY